MSSPTPPQPSISIKEHRQLPVGGNSRGGGHSWAAPKEASMQDLLSLRNCSCFEHIHNPTAMQELKKVNWNLQVT